MIQVISPKQKRLALSYQPLFAKSNYFSYTRFSLIRAFLPVRARK